MYGSVHANPKNNKMVKCFHGYQCYFFSFLVNGNWGTWTSFGVCDVSCGGGVSFRTRYCNSPVAAYGGVDCVLTGEIDVRGKEEVEPQPCNTHECPRKIIILIKKRNYLRSLSY